jgi:hypothetical protein
MREATVSASYPGACFSCSSLVPTAGLLLTMQAAAAVPRDQSPPRSADACCVPHEQDAVIPWQLFMVDIT